MSVPGCLLPPHQVRNLLKQGLQLVDGVHRSGKGADKAPAAAYAAICPEDGTLPGDESNEAKAGSAHIDSSKVLAADGTWRTCHS